MKVRSKTRGDLTWRPFDLYSSATQFFVKRQDSINLAGQSFSCFI